MTAAALAFLVAALAGAEERPAVHRQAVAASDPARREALDAAVLAIRERLRQREDEFRLAESAEAASVRLRVLNYRTWSEMRREIGHNQVRERVFESHLVDAVAIAGEARESLTGFDEREFGANLRNAASQLVDELERFCEEHCAASDR